MSAPTIELLDIHKSFGSTPVLEGVSMELFPGEVHSLMGENGAGKSTLVKIMAGLHQPDKGILRVEGRDTFFHSTAQAQHAGVAVIYQEPTLFPDLSIAENIFMGRQPTGRWGSIDYAKMSRAVSQQLAQLGVSLRPEDPVLGLSIADQQIVEIIKALTFDAKVLIMDEPTAALSAEEVRRLFQVVERLRKKGVALMFVSHRLEEVFEISQRITVMRDGHVVSSAPAEQFTPDDVVRKMVGRSLDALYPKEDVKPGEVVLSVKNLRRAGVFKDISFNVRRGEIVGLAGLVGAGRSEVARAIFGIDRLDSGEISVEGHPLSQLSPQMAMDAGIGFVPEDRQQQGLVMELSVLHNATLTVLGRLKRFGLISQQQEKKIAAEWTSRMRLKGHIEEPVNILSGGNQQKVVLAKWLATQPKFLIVDEPTRGIDVGAKSEVHRTLSHLAKAGMGILMISSDMPEVIGMADRVLVMHEGKLTAELSRSEATEEAIMFAAAGQTASKS